MTKFWVDAAGKVVKATDDSQVLEGLEAVMEAPERGLQRWDGAKWVDTPEYRRKRASAARGALGDDLGRVLDEMIKALEGDGMITDNDFSPEALEIIKRRREALT